ncbi:tetratricopeptide repeat-containing sulfotransferase family protein [Paraglaciecola sp.]|uniref:tetratricopeptide repeat-containing sulfotransferase family protein n=1 Tax=Paraglaciecola sp. TaxID=1920173 RepID=UPI003EF5ED4E
MTEKKILKLQKYIAEKKYLKVKSEAEKLIKKQSYLVPALHLRAQALVHLHRIDEALCDLKKAIIAEPNYYPALQNFAGIMLMQCNYDSALTYCRRALEISPNDPNSLMLLGDIFLGSGNNNKAILAYKDAYFKNLRTEKLLRQLVKSLLLDGRIEEAQDFLNIIPKDSFMRMKAQLDLFIEKGEVEQGLLLANELVTHKEVETSELIQSYKELGDMVSAKNLALSYRDTALPESALQIIQFGGVNEQWLEQYISNYPEAKIAPKYKKQYLTSIASYYKTKDQKKWFDYISKRNHYSLSLNEKFDIDNELNLLEQVIKAHQQVELKSTCSPNKTPIFIVGMPRSGTTLTETIIGTHSQCFPIGESSGLKVALNNGNTPTSLDSQLRYLDDLSNLDLNKVGEDYLRLVRNYSRTANHLVDKMPNNFLHIGDIIKVFPNAKIIHCRRNPINTCISIFEQGFSSFHDYGNSLETLIPYYKKYQKIMDYWQSSLAEGSFYQLDYEALTAAPEDEVRKLFAYCQLPFEQQCLDFHQQKRTVKTASIEQVRQAIYPSKNRWTEIEQQLKPLLDAFPEYIS